jgi:hypothetical protein
MSMLGLDIVVDGARREDKGSSILRQHLYAIMPGERGQKYRILACLEESLENAILKARKFIDAL